MQCHGCALSLGQAAAAYVSDLKSESFSLIFIASSLWSQTDILDARTTYGVGQTVTVTGIVTSDGNLGIVRYLQDETAGIALYPGGD